MRRRFFVDKFEDATATVRGETAEHLGRVLRAEPGQLYELSDGERVWLARVERIGHLKRGDQRVEFSLVEPIAAREPALHLHLLIALVKFDRFEWCLEKATELGVNEITPLIAARTDKALVAAAAKRHARWERIVLEVGAAVAAFAAAENRAGHGAGAGLPRFQRCLQDSAFGTQRRAADSRCVAGCQGAVGGDFDWAGGRVDGFRAGGRARCWIPGSVAGRAGIAHGDGGAGVTGDFAFRVGCVKQDEPQRRRVRRERQKIYTENTEERRRKI